MVLASVFVGLLTLWAIEIVFNSNLITNVINSLRNIFSETEEEYVNNK